VFAFSVLFGLLALPRWIKINLFFGTDLAATGTVLAAAGLVLSIWQSRKRTPAGGAKSSKTWNDPHP
jgi:hypothetical protein